jgi:hypothetical protein
MIEAQTGRRRAGRQPVLHRTSERLAESDQRFTAALLAYAMHEQHAKFVRLGQLNSLLRPVAGRRTGTAAREKRDMQWRDAPAGDIINVPGVVVKRVPAARTEF